MLGKSWRSSVGGIFAIITGVIAIAQPIVSTGNVTDDPNSLMTAIGLIASGIGLIKAKDKAVTGLEEKKEQ